MSILSSKELNSRERKLINVSVLVKLLQALEKKYEGMTGLPSPEKVENSKKRKAAVGFGKWLSSRSFYDKFYFSQ